MFKLLFFWIEFSSFDRKQLEFHFLSRAEHKGGYFFANGQTGYHAHEIGHFFFIADVGFPVTEPQEQVASLQAAAEGGRIVDHPTDQHAAFVGGVFEKRLHIHTKPASLHLAVRNELLGNVMSEISRDRAAKTKADFVNTDDLSLQVNKRTARVTSVNGGIMADPAHERAYVHAIEAKAAHRAEHLGHDHFSVADNA